jgi:hypothetical protein
MLKILGYINYGNQYDRDGFRVVLEGLPHGATHNYLGGHMRSFISPGDPIFFSHHAYIDKLWTVWQECHGYDDPEVKAMLIQKGNVSETRKYYEHTRGYDKDGPNDAMPFFMTPNFDIGGTDECPGTGLQCAKTTAACAECVHKQDSWCSSSAWDQTCCALCTSEQCAEACGAEVPKEIDFNRNGPDHLQDWVLDESTPAHVYSVKAMAHQYSYARDEIEKHLAEKAPEAFGTCIEQFQRSSSLLSVEVHEEISRLHHTHTLRGQRAAHYANMVASSFKQAKCDMDKEANTTSSFAEGGESQDATQQQFQLAMKLAQQEECRGMAMGARGNYKRAYHCEADSPRYLLPWLGSKTWHQIKRKEEVARAVFCDPCCEGNGCLDYDKAVPAYH